jgi:hypothetical protein
MATPTIVFTLALELLLLRLKIRSLSFRVLYRLDHL